MNSETHLAITEVLGSLKARDRRASTLTFGIALVMPLDPTTRDLLLKAYDHFINNRLYHAEDYLSFLLELQKPVDK